jgi:hypothetical protein
MTTEYKKVVKLRAKSILGTYNSTTEKWRNNLFWFSAIKYILKSDRNLFNN